MKKAIVILTVAVLVATVAVPAVGAALTSEDETDRLMAPKTGGFRKTSADSPARWWINPAPCPGTKRQASADSPARWWINPKPPGTYRIARADDRIPVVPPTFGIDGMAWCG